MNDELTQAVQIIRRLSENVEPTDAEFEAIATIINEAGNVIQSQNRVLQLLETQARAQWRRANLLSTALAQVESIIKLDSIPVDLKFTLIGKGAREALCAETDDPVAEADFDDWLAKVKSIASAGLDVKEGES
jgi:hypothetical protein